MSTRSLPVALRKAETEPETKIDNHEPGAERFDKHVNPFCQLYGESS
jgi:hypothetical protein